MKKDWKSNLLVSDCHTWVYVSKSFFIVVVWGMKIEKFSQQLFGIKVSKTWQTEWKVFTMWCIQVLSQAF